MYKNFARNCFVLTELQDVTLLSLSKSQALLSFRKSLVFLTRNQKSFALLPRKIRCSLHER